MTVSGYHGDGKRYGGDSTFDTVYMQPYVDEHEGWVVDDDTGEVIYMSPARRAVIGLE